MSNATNRIIFGLLIGAGVSYVVFVEHWNWFFIFALVCFFALGGLLEFYRLNERKQREYPFYKIGFVFSSLILLYSYLQFLSAKRLQGHKFHYFYDLFLDFASFQYPESTGFFMISFFFVLGIARLMQPSSTSSIYGMAVTLVGPVYTVLTINYVFALLLLPYGEFYLFIALFLPTMTDTGGYFFGRLLGRHKVGLKVSPNKTYEGYIGGIIFSCIMAFATLQVWGWWAQLHSYTVPLDYRAVLVLSLLLSLSAILGDLFASSFKRAAGVDDSSKLVPGHGGILDMIDSIYFSIPLGYFYIIYFV